MRICTYLCVAIASILLVGTESTRVHAAAEPDVLNQQMEDLSFAAVPLDMVIGSIREKSGANISINWGALHRAGIERSTKVTIDLPAPVLGDALTQILKRAGGDKAQLDFVDEGGLVYISTVEDVQKQAKLSPLPPRGDPDAAAKTVEALDHPMPEVNTNGVGLSDSIDFLKQITQLKIEVNWDALKAAGVEKDAPVSYRLRDLPLKKVLRVLLDDLDAKEPLQFVVDGDKILISTEKDLAKN
jgi:hypothetical protein